MIFSDGNYLYSRKDFLTGEISFTADPTGVVAEFDPDNFDENGIVNPQEY